MMALLALIPVVIWLYLLVGRGLFWMTSPGRWVRRPFQSGRQGSVEPSFW